MSVTSLRRWLESGMCVYEGRSHPSGPNPAKAEPYQQNPGTDQPPEEENGFMESR